MINSLVENHVEIIFAFKIFKCFLESGIKKQSTGVVLWKDVYVYEKSHDINCAGVFFK